MWEGEEERKTVEIKELLVISISISSETAAHLKA
jgi:hypothetical protein